MRESVLKIGRYMGYILQNKRLKFNSQSADFKSFSHVTRCKKNSIFDTIIENDGIPWPEIHFTRCVCCPACISAGTNTNYSTLAFPHEMQLITVAFSVFWVSCFMCFVLWKQCLPIINSSNTNKLSNVPLRSQRHHLYLKIYLEIVFQMEINSQIYFTN